MPESFQSRDEFERRLQSVASELRTQHGIEVQGSGYKLWVGRDSDDMDSEEAYDVLDAVNDTFQKHGLGSVYSRNVGNGDWEHEDADGGFLEISPGHQLYPGSDADYKDFNLGGGGTAMTSPNNGPHINPYDSNMSPDEVQDFMRTRSDPTSTDEVLEYVRNRPGSGDSSPPGMFGGGSLEESLEEAGRIADGGDMPGADSMGSMDDGMSMDSDGMQGSADTARIQKAVEEYSLARETIPYEDRRDIGPMTQANAQRLMDAIGMDGDEFDWRSWEYSTGEDSDEAGGIDIVSGVSNIQHQLADREDDDYYGDDYDDGPSAPMPPSGGVSADEIRAMAASAQGAPPTIELSPEQEGIGNAIKGMMSMIAPRAEYIDVDADGIAHDYFDSQGNPTDPEAATQAIADLIDEHGQFQSKEQQDAVIRRIEEMVNAESVPASASADDSRDSDTPDISINVNLDLDDLPRSKTSDLGMSDSERSSLGDSMRGDRGGDRDAGLDKSMEYRGMPKGMPWRPSRGRGGHEMRASRR